KPEELPSSQVTRHFLVFLAAIHKTLAGGSRLRERLEAARSNLRFQDRRLASLEAELLDHARKS
ncbi:hypothetical protein AB0389_37800, partial [Streptomyces sp. NPDC093109]